MDLVSNNAKKTCRSTSTIPFSYGNTCILRVILRYILSDVNLFCCVLTHSKLTKNLSKMKKKNEGKSHGKLKGAIEASC